MDGDTLVVGANLHSNGVHTGAAFVYSRDTHGFAYSAWTQSASLTIETSLVVKSFGSSVAIDGDIIVVGSDDIDGDFGAAFVYLRDDVGAPSSAWSQSTMIQGESNRYDTRFGESVAVGGDMIVVGRAAPTDGDIPLDSGSVRVFTRLERLDGDWLSSKWHEMPALAPTVDEYGMPVRKDHFGSSVAVWNGTVVVGATGDDKGFLVDAGSVSVFEVTTADAAAAAAATRRRSPSGTRRFS